jgi:hypothetical protein
MTNRTQTLLVCLGGFMAGGLTASMVHWSAFPKAAIVAAVATSAALAVGVVTRNAVARRP